MYIGRDQVSVSSHGCGQGCCGSTSRPQSILKVYRTFAVVGATTDPEKYGNRIVKALAQAGYTVLPVNPKYTEVEGLRCLPDLASLPVDPDVVVSVVPPSLTLPLVEACLSRGVLALWLQPGTWDQAVLDACDRADLPSVSDTCILVALSERGSGCCSC